MLPNFFIIGAPRCGTTSLYAYLRGRPDVFLPPRKEPSFWCTDFPGFRTVTDQQKYLRLFAGAGERSIVGEASTLYFYSREAPRQIVEFNPAAKILIMLRNPLELVTSWHSHLYYTGDEDQSDFQSAWQLQEDRRQGRCVPPDCRAPELLDYTRIGKLGAEVRRWLEVFPSEQVKCWLLEDFALNPDRACREVVDFLGLPFDGRTLFPKSNENKTVHSRPLVWALRRMPNWMSRGVLAAKKLFGAHDFGSYRLVTKLQPRPPLSREMEVEMTQAFSADIGDLARLLGRDLTAWFDPAASEMAFASRDAVESSAIDSQMNINTT